MDIGIVSIGEGNRIMAMAKCPNCGKAAKDCTCGAKGKGAKGGKAKPGKGGKGGKMGR